MKQYMCGKDSQNTRKYKFSLHYVHSNNCNFHKQNMLLLTHAVDPVLQVYKRHSIGTCLSIYFSALQRDVYI